VCVALFFSLFVLFVRLCVSVLFVLFSPRLCSCALALSLSLSLSCCLFHSSSTLLLSVIVIVTFVIFLHLRRCCSLCCCHTIVVQSLSSYFQVLLVFVTSLLAVLCLSVLLHNPLHLCFQRILLYQIPVTNKDDAAAAV
jgi:hypothetical protein